jgi:hypothetical protein
MWVFIIAGALYLIGVAVVLVLKPSFMFTPDGNWKEFGIGQNPERCTTFPFWLFCITWALVSYTLVLVIVPFIIDDESDMNNTDTMNYRRRKRNNRNNRNNINNINNMPENDSDLVFDDEIEGDAQTLPKGYYVLNKKASRLAGVPKYVFISEE